MFILYAIFLASAGLLSLADASAIKGHVNARPYDEVRSIKLVPASNNLDKTAKAVHLQAPILESTKKIYNDESIRRFLAQQPINAPPSVVEQVPAKRAESVAPVSSPVAVAPAPVKVASIETVAAPVAATAPLVPAPEPVAPAVVSPSEQPVAPIVVKEPLAPVVVAAPAVIEPKRMPVEPVVAKPTEELPPQSDRSAVVPAPIAVPAPVEQMAPVVNVAEQSANGVVVAAPQQQQAPVVAPAAAVQVQPEPAAPVVVVAAQSQPEPMSAQLKDSPLEAKKDEPAQLEPLHIEVPAPDPGLVLSEPIDSTTKLLIDLDEHVQKFLPAEDQQQLAKDQSLVAGVDYSPPVNSEPSGKSSVPLVPYSISGVEEAIVPPLPQLDGVEKASASGSSSGQSASLGLPAQASPSQPAASAAVSSPSAARQGGQTHQSQQQVITQLLDQLDVLQTRIQDTINQLVARRRYVMSALLRPMGTYVRRVRTNLERLQNRVNQLQAAASSVGGGQNRPGGFVDAAAIETIRRRIDDISKRISDIVNRIRFSLTPTSAPLNSNGRK